MSKFNFMTDQPIVIAEYNVYCKGFEFHSDHYEGTCDGRDLVIDLNDIYAVPRANFYQGTPKLGDVICLVGINDSFVVNGVSKGLVNGTAGALKISILANVNNHE